MKKKRDDGIPVRGTCVKKWFLVMKLICVFTLFLLFKVSANGLAQKKINLDLERVSMLEIIQELRQQTGYKFLEKIFKEPFRLEKWRVFIVVVVA